MQQQMMMQQQIMNQKVMNNQQEFISVRFRLTFGKLITVTVKSETTVEDLFKKFIDRVPNFSIERIKFLYNGKEINKKETKDVENYFKPNYIPLITVLNY